MPTPTLMENLHKLSGTKCFTIVDVKEGFLNIPLDHESSMATTMHTSFGRYRWLRLPFGVSSAPEEFQQRLMTALEGLDGLANIADDIHVGDTYAEAELDHDKNLIALMNRAFEKDIRFNLAKLKFKLKEVKFMGDIISADGRKPDPDKVRAIVELRQPHDKAALLHFMMNYLSPFCPNLSATLKPPRSLTHDGVPYLWSSTQEEAFMKAIWATRSLKTSWPRLQLL